MNRQCIKCNNEIIKLNLSQKQKIEIGNLLELNKKLQIVKKLKDEYGFSHIESKIIADHLNQKTGKCGRCDYEKLNEEYMDCPKCKAFNYNIKFK